MHRSHALRFKHDDTRLLVGLGLAYVVLAVAAALVLPTEAAVLTMVGVALVAGAALQLQVHRTRQADQEQHARHVQALLSLHALVPLRASLPPFTGWAASAELAATLHTLVRTHQPRTVVELGSGVSTLIVAYALEQNGSGHLVSLDHEADYGAATRQHLSRHALSAWGEVRHAPLVAQQVDGRTVRWYDLAALDGAGEDGVPEIDLLIVDGPPYQTNPLARYPAGPLLADRLSARAIIVADDAERDDEAEAVRRWQADLGPFEVERFPSPKGTTVLRRV